MASEYFASLPIDEIGSELYSKVESFDAHMRSFRVFMDMRQAYKYYIGLTNSGYSSTHLGVAGDQAEKSVLKVNKVRNFVDRQLTIITSNRPALIPLSINSDYDSYAQTVLAGSILDYYTRQQRLERYWKQTCENALLFGTGFLKMDWDATAGDPYAVADVLDDDGQKVGEKMIMTGDIRFESLTPFDVVIDTSKRNADFSWYIVRTYKNRYDLVAKYSAFKDEILSLAETGNIFQNPLDEVLPDRTVLAERGDDVPVYEFYHKKTDALPQGRYVKFVSGNIVLEDAPLPVSKIPIIRLVPAEYINLPHGYTTTFGLLAPQEVTDNIYSMIVSGQLTFGGNTIAVPVTGEGGVDPIALGGGSNIIPYDPTTGQKPEVLQLLRTAPEMFTTLDRMQDEMQLISGINDVVLGDPGANLKSGAFAALVASQSVQFLSSLQEAYNAMLEDTGTLLFEYLKKFASTSRRISVIVGKSQRYMLKSFEAKDLEGIERVQVDVGNPLSKTHAGRLKMAEDLLAKGMIKTPDQYIMVLTTGRLEPITESEQTQAMLIKKENEEMQEGRVPDALIFDDHKKHIIEHASVVGDPASRRDPKKMQAVRAHIDQHMALLRDPMNAELLALFGQQPAPNPAAAAGGSAAPAGAGVAEIADPGAAAEANMPNQPNQPVNPQTGERFDPEAGQ